MRGVRRLLWSLILLTPFGCQSIQTGSTGLSGRLSAALKAPAARPAAQEEGLVALLAARRSAKRDQPPPGQLQPPQPSPQSSQPQQPSTPRLPGRWAEDEVLRMVVETELAHASPSERAALIRRLDRASEDEVADLLTEWRRSRRPAAPRPQTDTRPPQPSVQPIILTGHAEPIEPSAPTPATSTATPSGPPVTTARPVHPLQERTAHLAAPRPGGGRHAAGQDPGPVQTAAAQPATTAGEPPPAVIPVMDAFGVGAESRAAQQGLAETSRIGLAGRQPTDEPDTHAEAIARDLDSNRTAQSVYWQEDLDKLITLLEAQVAQQKPGNTDVSRDEYIRQHVALRMLYLIASRQPEALQAIPGVSSDRQEFWTRMFWALSSIFDEEAMPNSTVRAAETVAQLRAAIEQIEPRASLELRNAVFCRQINGFGDFVTFDEQPFAPGQPVLIYTEVRNFHSQPTEAGSYRTMLRSTITIQQGSVSGPVVFRHDLPETEDRCQSRRQDYFHSFRIHLPETLKPGPHVLTLDMTDAVTGKNGSTTLNFLVR